MGFTVEDAMRLPSLRNAKLAGGKAGLKNNVFGVNVFDFKLSENLQDRFFAKDDRHLSNQIVITSFSFMQDDEALQCKYLRKLCEIGESALVLYYVGVIVKTLSDRLVATADEINQRAQTYCMKKGGKR